MNLQRYAYLAACVLMVVMITTPHARADTDSEAQLQWILGLSDSEWRTELGQIARALKQKDTEEADLILAEWITSLPEPALLELPKMGVFFDHFTEYSIAPVYASTLLQVKSGRQIFQDLGYLNLSNYAVHKVGVEVLQNWWRTDAEQMLLWLETTPGIYLHGYLESFFENTPEHKQDIARWVNFFWELPEGDPRKDRFLNDFFYEYLEINDAQAAQFLGAHLSASSPATVKRLDALISQFTYWCASNLQHAKAVEWVSKITNKADRELAFRNAIFLTEKSEELSPYQNWLSTNTIEDPILLQDTSEQLRRFSTQPDLKSDQQ